MGHEVSKPIGVSIVSSLGRDEDDSIAVHDGHGEHGRVGVARCSSNGVQGYDGHAKGGRADPSTADSDNRTVEQVQCLKAKVG
jgi:hypothetical protein